MAIPCLSPATDMVSAEKADMFIRCPNKMVTMLQNTAPSKWQVPHYVVGGEPDGGDGVMGWNVALRARDVPCGESTTPRRGMLHDAAWPGHHAGS